jgi:tRNA dimethylallyltransferase
LPRPKEGLRELLNQNYKEKGINFIRERLSKIDPVYYKAVDISNPQRMIRAIEVFETTGIPFSIWRKNNKKERNFRTLSIGLNIERNLLYDQINQRVDDMINNGLLKEVETLLPFKEYSPLKTVGYTELFDYIDGKYTLEEAVAKIKQNTRKYAKRQLTWFRKNQNTVWFNPNEIPAVINYIESNI